MTPTPTEQPRAGRATLPTAIAAAVCVVGFTWVWLAGPFGADPLCAERQPDGATYRLEAAAWPPGTTRCVSETPQAVTRSETLVPWSDWLALGLVAAAAGLIAAALQRGRLPARDAWTVLCLVAGALAVLFVGLG